MKPDSKLGIGITKDELDLFNNFIAIPKRR